MRMTVDLRWLWSRINANYWFYPALFSLLSVALAFALVHVDRMGAAEWLNDAQLIVAARPEGASNMLTVIAGSMIGVASTVFSITIAAVVYASGTYGPRILTNFLEDRGNQLSLATFIGTFVYAITVLRTVRAEYEAAASAGEAAATTLPGFVPQLSLLVAYLLMAFSVAVLVYFLNHIPSSIHINNVLKEIGQRLLEDVRGNYPEDCAGEDVASAPGGTPLPVERTGYVQLIDFAELEQIAKETGCTFALEVRTGNFVHPGMALVRICKGAASEDIARRTTRAFTLGANRTATQDPQFLIDELVEIGLRALSPALNDPFTAITAIHWLGAATAELGRRNLVQRREDHPNGHNVHPLPETYSHFLQRGFGALRSSVAANPNAALVMLDALRTAAAPVTDPGRRQQLRDQGDKLMAQSRLALGGPDLAEVEDRYATFLNAFEG